MTTVAALVASFGRGDDSYRRRRDWAFAVNGSFAGPALLSTALDGRAAERDV